MKNRKVKSNEATKSQERKRSLPDELANLYIRIAERRQHTRKFDINETLSFLNSCIKLFDKYIQKEDLRNLATIQCLMAHAYYELGLARPLHLRLGAQRGGRADKKRKGIQMAIETLLPQIKRLSPMLAWRLFKREHPSSKPLNLGRYEIYFAADSTGNESEDLLVQAYGLEESTIKYKTFERYFYRALKETPQIEI